jgi:acyl phosphate:glycerol-3-phosphate acyltransferase
MLGDWNGWVAYAVMTTVLFFCGSIPTGYLLGRLRGIDLRQHGSGNIGATNAIRVLGRPLGLLVFAGDFAKGCVPLVVGRVLLEGWPEGLAKEGLFLVGAVAAILGHNFTPWLGFKGGKGIATSAGVLAAVMPWTLVIAFSAWVVVLLTSRYVSVASMAASLMLPVATGLVYREQWVLLAFSLVAGGLGLWRHRGNWQRLREGTEPTIDQTRMERQARGNGP